MVQSAWIINWKLITDLTPEEAEFIYDNFALIDGSANEFIVEEEDFKEPSDMDLNEAELEDWKNTRQKFRRLVELLKKKCEEEDGSFELAVG